ncbi:MAG TPA: FecR family protein [Bryobacteraceae bacterium]|nr:FecR family protein [Bryobacteraceae bacterium]
MGGSRINTAGLSLLMAAAGVLCPLAQAQFWTPADANQYAAKAVSVTGRVSVLRDGVEYAIEMGGEVRVKELIFTGSDGQARFQVSDGSYFDVFPNSRVVFRKNVPNWRDLIDVLVGRVKVHIEHWGDQPNPNRVITPTAVISVRGTTFDITVDDDDESTLVEVEEGTVAVRHALLPGNNPKLVTTGESLKVYRDQPIANNGIDKGALAQRILRMAVNALSTWESRRGGVGGVGAPGGSSGGGTGDTKKPPPPSSPGGGTGPGAPPPPPSSPGVPPSAGGGGFLSTNTTIYAHHQGYAGEGRWHKFAHRVLDTVSRVVLGTSPDDEVIRAAGH